MHTKQEIQSLLDDYITGSLDAAGRAKLMGIFQDPAYEEMLGGMMDEALKERMAGSYHFPETAQRLKSNLLRHIHATQAPDQEDPAAPRVVSIRRRLGIWAGAAAAVAAVVVALYMYEKPPATAPPVLASIQPAPGGNKAILELSDGSTVQLDSTGDRQISQGPAAINQQNGSLQYTAMDAGNAQGYNTLRTPRGGQFQVTLHDGTRVWLNSASSLRYPVVFNGRERVVELSGQGYFEITANANKPFRVKINKATEVQVLGTSFDVMAYPDEVAVKTTLVQGAVRIMHKSASQTLRPGQQAVMEPGVQQISVLETDVKKVTDWKNGLFIFNNTDLPAILREVARWYDVDIVYNAPPNKNLYGGGLSRKMALADVLLFLEEGGANHFKIEGRKVIVLP